MTMYTLTALFYLALAFGVECRVEVTTHAAPETTCSQGETKFSKADLEVIVDTFSPKTISLLNESFYGEAIAVRDKYIKDLHTFLNWFDQRPENFKNALEELKNTRKVLQPLIEKVIKEGKKYSMLMQSYNLSLTHAQRLERKFEKVKQECNDLCTPDNDAPGVILVQRALNQLTPVQDDEFYCGQFENILKKVKIQMGDFVEHTKNHLKAQLESDDKGYGQEVEELKNKLKKMALEEFGLVMYDILNLQSNYYMVQQVVSNHSIPKLVYNIEDSLLHSKIIIFHLHENLMNLEQKCTINCSSRSQEITLRSKSNSLLSEVIETKQTLITETIVKEYTDIFEELQNSLNFQNKNITNKYINNLKPIYDAMQELIKEEVNKFHELEQSIPLKTLHHLFVLETQTDALLKKVSIMEADVIKYSNKWNS